MLRPNGIISGGATPVTAPLCSHLVVLLERNTQQKGQNRLFSNILKEHPQSVLIIYPVFKIREIPPSSTPSETRWTASGCPKRTLAQWSPPAATRSHESSTTEATSSSVVPERDAKCLRIHASLFSPG